MAKRQEIRKRLNKEKPTEYKKPEMPRIIDDSTLRPQAIIPVNYHRLLAWLIFAFTLVIYMSTQARTMSFWDSGEYATCSSILGVPHPPGNPFYIVIGRAIIALFGWLVPHGMISAFISALASAFAVMFTYLFTVKLVSMLKVKSWEAMFAGTVAALFTAFSFTFWMNAIEAEVYSGLVFFVNLILWLTLVWLQKSRDYDHQNILLFIVYLFFLGFCVHQTALQIAPAVLFIIVYPMLQKGRRKDNFWMKVLGYTAAILMGYFIFGAIGQSLSIDEFDKWGFALIAVIIMAYELRDIFGKKFWFMSIALVLVGLSSHIYLMIRAADRPFINEGMPSTLSSFWDYVLRKQYGNTSFVVRRGSFFGDQMGFHFLRYFGMQWFPEGILAPLVNMGSALGKGIGNLFVALLGLGGALFQQKRNRHSFRYFLVVVLLTSIVMVFVMNLSNAEVRDRDYFFVAAYNMWAVWMGMGALGLISLFKSDKVKYILAAVLLLFPIGNMISQYHTHDRSNEFIALDYGVNFLNSIEENAIIFTNGDNDTFPLWYAQAVHDPWAKEHVYPAEDVQPSEAAQKAMDSALEYKNKYLKGIRKDVSVANLSLLNTPWYIRQLRDKEGILFSYPDDRIDEMRITKLGRNLEVPGTPASGSFILDIDETPPWRPNEPFYRVSDLSVMQIIKDNFGHRPIYFAVTCESYIGFEDYTRNEGMVARVVSTKEYDQENIPRLLSNIDEVYEYRSIDDARVFKDDNMRRLVLNYGSGFVRAASHFADIGDFEKATSYIDRGRIFIDDEIKLTEFYTTFYSGNGEWKKLEDFVDRVIFPHQDGWKIYISYVLAHLMESYPRQSIPFIEKGLLSFPNESYFANVALHYAETYGHIDEIKTMLTRSGPRLGYDIQRYLSALDAPVEYDPQQRR
ncbi:MAG: DUF2723 domain-containing protein [Candidatus Cloacimonadaceae bacterium]|jgi:hypothetical protein|nr:DUF2723 domain-containing protein [Candidatus Cloacimonadota bacterium]MCB5255169.1 DUF2723 domain-containing protein [Candidatus Cloacimonadota bacterium]MCK9177642.1 DUF2723 domain-containing protein [Candidatus Cloacimonadota bacterium]MCK9243262.1 DUF2723 domain-containing protein [Candidatus Cloacimonadota bacterium]MDY0127153.1 DUF2723 domain-containing protein [Candidatus Cloacimonadaceae bacterium]